MPLTGVKPGEHTSHTLTETEHDKQLVSRQGKTEHAEPFAIKPVAHPVQLDADVGQFKQLRSAQGTHEPEVGAKPVAQLSHTVGTAQARQLASVHVVLNVQLPFVT